jgi:membrane protein implicated in regulation of membrane protease activity
MVLPVLLAVGTIAAGLAAEPWLTLIAVGLLYLISIPLSVRAALRLRRAFHRQVSEAPVEATGEPENPPA